MCQVTKCLVTAGGRVVSLEERLLGCPNSYKQILINVPHPICKLMGTKLRALGTILRNRETLGTKHQLGTKLIGGGHISDFRETIGHPNNFLVAGGSNPMTGVGTSHPRRQSPKTAARDIKAAPRLQATLDAICSTVRPPPWTSTSQL